MLETLRNMWRRKLRTALTVFGIAIGIFAFTVMGSMAEKFNKLIEGALDFYGTAINVQAESGGAFGGGVFETDRLQDLRDLSGVAEVYPQVTMLLKRPSEQGFSFGPPQIVLGIEPSESYAQRTQEYGLNLIGGEWLTEEDEKAAIVGADLAEAHDLYVGSVLQIREEPFLVKGVLERSLRVTDNMAIVPIAEARDLLTKDLPLLETDDIVTEAQVFPTPGTDVDGLAERITEDIPQIRALSPNEFRRQFEAGAVVFNLIIFGVALIAVIVGGLSVINTMIMSVSERTREIGIKRAVGAETRHILFEYMGEAALIGLLGGVIGFAVGWGLTVLVNSQTAGSGTIIFTMTPRLAIGSLAFSIVLGALAGIYPAARAARMNPVKALRTM